ncbi:methylated-DNA--[protein]-cysteine S-methyltransferase [Streptomyces sp. NP160]|uniref:methylated-DNA--[protein]-cysteine S-methyltransferase n=1 Tax=Streptomyces sp. NP160 TaxID=2586637 RepID=UPI00111A9BD6|nr:methylated-DNA--[protein]-cysteine S-methyltransferase [Streptomyces sp. NP160]TNM64410.1 methylated-DNA--[protein]-cysteine S-methyltransferase [Streptomyces sp. NP160]
MVLEMTLPAAAPGERVLAACRAMDQAGGPLPLEDLASLTGWSTRQLGRRFAEVLGTTPRAYGEALRTQRLRPALREGRAGGGTVLDAAFAAGYGSVRAFYEQGAARLGMTPSQYAAGGSGERLLWSAGPVDVGGVEVRRVLVVASLAGVVAVRIGDDDDALLAEVAAELPLADLDHEPEVLTDVVAAVAALARGAGDAPEGAAALPLDVRGTAFQAAVWAALRRIPAGQTRSYAEVAAELGRPTAVRAVARACATNPAALVTPCHRVVRSDGGLGGFRWGLEVKRALLAAEQQR